MGKIVSNPDYGPALVIALPENVAKGKKLKDQHFSVGEVQWEGLLNKNETKAVITLDSDDTVAISKYYVSAFLNGSGNQELVKKWAQERGQDPEETIMRFKEDPYSLPFLKYDYINLRNAIERRLIAKAYKFLEQFSDI